MEYLKLRKREEVLALHLHIEKSWNSYGSTFVEIIKKHLENIKTTPPEFRVGL